MLLGRARAVEPRDLGVGQRQEVVALGVEEVGHARAEALVRAAAACPRSRDVPSRCGRARGGMAWAQYRAASVGSAPHMVDIDALLRPFWDTIQSVARAALDLFDAHTHIGQNDPDGFKQTPAELIEVMTTRRRAGVVFPMHEPDGYPGPNDASIAAAAASDGRLVSFCRLDPRVSPADGGAALPGRRRGRHQAAPARRAVHDGRAGRARDRRGRPRAARAGADPRGTRDSRAGPRHGRRCRASSRTRG